MIGSFENGQIDLLATAFQGLPDPFQILSNKLDFKHECTYIFQKI
jgi:hypothetical protein